jgi:tRNA-specific 2-thiouridylase
VKFARLSERAEVLGFDAVATGHHARIGRTVNGHYTLERSVDRTKDQSYVVHMLGQRDLASTLFPIGEITKDEVRRIAARLGLRTATKPDSQDVCFVTSTGGREQFLGSRIPFRRADVVDTSGRPMGTIDTLELVTVGQRRGLGLPGGGPKRYVVGVDHTAAIVTIGSADELVDSDLHVTDVSWVDAPRAGEVLVQCSAHGVPHPATIAPARGGIDVTWTVPQRRVAPGQSVVFYDPSDRIVYGGGLAAAS